MDCIIKTDKLSKQYKTATALDRISISIPAGAIYGLIGNNGAGKTTLMSILAKLQKQTSGSVQKARGVKIGALIEAPAFYPMCSSYGNLKYQKNLLGAKEADIKELLAFVGLSDFKKPTRNYSLGMKQRLGLAMALVGNPDFLILNEPLNGLDPEGIRDIRSLIVELNEKYGKTILISSHILSELQKTATYYGFLKNGTLIQEFSNDALDTDLETFYFKNFA